MICNSPIRQHLGFQAIESKEEFKLVNDQPVPENIKLSKTTSKEPTLEDIFLDALMANVDEAARLFKLAADQNSAEAQVALGLCYQYGQGVVKDEKEAIRLFGLAAEQGLADGQVCLGQSYRLGKILEKNEAKAI